MQRGLVNQLHAACQERPLPEDRIQSLVRQHPSAVEYRGADGWLLIHRICRRQPSKALLIALLQPWPDSLKEWTQDGVRDLGARLPIHLACQYGARLSVVKYLARAFPASLTATCRDHEMTPLDYAYQCQEQDDLEHTQSVIDWLESMIPDYQRPARRARHTIVQEDEETQLLLEASSVAGASDLTSLMGDEEPFERFSSISQSIVEENDDNEDDSDSRVTPASSEGTAPPVFPPLPPALSNIPGPCSLPPLAKPQRSSTETTAATSGSESTPVVQDHDDDDEDSTAVTTNHPQNSVAISSHRGFTLLRAQNSSLESLPEAPEQATTASVTLQDEEVVKSDEVVSRESTAAPSPLHSCSVYHNDNAESHSASAATRSESSAPNLQPCALYDNESDTQSVTSRQLSVASMSSVSTQSTMVRSEPTAFLTQPIIRSSSSGVGSQSMASSSAYSVMASLLAVSNAASQATTVVPKHTNPKRQKGKYRLNLVARSNLDKYSSRLLQEVCKMPPTADSHLHIRRTLEKCPDAIHAISDYGGYTPLHYACEMGASVDVIRCLLETSPYLISFKTDAGYLPLHFCFASTHPKPPLDMVRYLILRYPQALRVRTDEDGMLPLHLACYHGAHAELVRELLRHDGSAHSFVSVTNTTNKTPLDLAKHPAFPLVKVNQEVVQILGAVSVMQQ